MPNKYVIAAAEDLEMELETLQFRKIISDLRHKSTNYEKLATFYECQPKYRRRLNAICGDYARGMLTEEQFKAEIRLVEAEVNLTIKKNQKRYIKEYMGNAINGGDVNSKRAKSRAEDALTKVLQFNAYVNKKRKDGRA